MTKKNTVMYIVTNLAIFLPSPPYLAYGIILITALIVIFSSSICFSYYIRTLDSTWKTALMVLCAASITVLFHQGIMFFSPLIGLSLGFIIYLIPLSFLTFDSLVARETETPQEKRRQSFKILFILAALSLLFFVIREFLSFGTLSYPISSGLKIIDFPIKVFEGYAFFWTSIPGGLVILAIFMVILPSLLHTKEEVEK